MQTTTRPDPGKMFGLTHALDGQPIVREPKLVKLSIGHPKGRALEVWIGQDKKWYVRQGYKKDERKTLSFDTRKEAEKLYWETHENSPSCPYPRKLSYFTFNRQGPDGNYVPDFGAIEAHGAEPTEIDLVFFDTNPFAGQYAMWSASELKCKGDGVNAERVLSMAKGTEQLGLAEKAKTMGGKFFPIVNGCWTTGCPFSEKDCKPSGDLRFQLCHKITLGGSAFFHTTGYRSISQLFSSLYRIKMVTGGRIMGIPLKMILRSFKTKHEGKTGTAYGVSLELRASDVEDLQKKMLEQGRSFWNLANPQDVPRQITAPADDMPIESDDESPISAQAMHDEFYPTEGDEEGQATESEKVAEKTKTATDGLTEKLKASATKRAKKQEEPKPAETQPEPPPPTDEQPPEPILVEMGPGDDFF
jgi:hypothetical protein